MQKYLCFLKGLTRYAWLNFAVQSGIFRVLTWPMPCIFPVVRCGQIYSHQISASKQDSLTWILALRVVMLQIKVGMKDATEETKQLDTVTNWWNHSNWSLFTGSFVTGDGCGATQLNIAGVTWHWPWYSHVTRLQPCIQGYIFINFINFKLDWVNFLHSWKIN